MRQSSRFTKVVAALAATVSFLCIMHLARGSCSAFNKAPMLAPGVVWGELSPVGRRLPSASVVVTPVDRLGTYGEVWRRSYCSTRGSWEPTQGHLSTKEPSTDQGHQPKLPRNGGIPA